MSDFYSTCTKCGDEIVIGAKRHQAQTGRIGFVCDICHTAENDCRRFEETGEFTKRNIRLNYIYGENTNDRQYR